ncbi:MAG: carbohydrate binding family 9 domain-containing protein, partial [Gemmatimonadetes bacterium]|nr:carbohydrate binding family 9 domain-containing protein [Gemmatimonadota bacterium]
MRYRMWGLAALASSISVPGAAQVQRPDVNATRVDVAPVIDGLLNEAVWNDATPASDFRQKEPLEGEPATERTRVRILYDGATLYVGVELFDTDPERIRASELRRDDALDSDDSFSILLDTFHDHRNAFVFRINPLGTRFDATVRNESGFLNRDWDEQWTAAATITQAGWTAELAIPFKILRFGGDEEQIWGINFERVIKRKNESVYWSGWDRDFSFTHVSQAAHLVGLSDIEQVERLRLRPYVVTGVRRLDAVSSPTGSHMVGDVGIDDLKFAITSNLTADVAVNPDFAQTEVDAQRVNLTRFSLFFPEKRQFFIEGSDAMRTGIGLLHFGPPPLELFYSRSIGLSSAGEPIALVAGGKLTGKAGGLNLGILNAQTAAIGNQDGENFSVARVRKDVLQRSYVGAIVTNREGGGTFNRVVAADARFIFKEHLTVAGLVARSFEPDVTNDSWVHHVAAEWRDDLVEAGVIYLDIEPNFDPGVGFVRRRERMIGTRFSFKPRPGGDLVRQLTFSPSFVYFHDSDGVLQTRRVQFRAGVSLQSGDRLQIDFENRLEQLDRPFTIGPNVTLAPARYEWHTIGVDFNTFNGRRVSGSIGVDVGDFYTGTKRSLTLQSVVRPNSNISFNPSYRYNDIDLQEGSFDTHLVGLRSNISFTSNLLTSAFLQYTSSGNLVAAAIRAAPAALLIVVAALAIYSPFYFGSFSSQVSPGAPIGAAPYASR